VLFRSRRSDRPPIEDVDADERRGVDDLVVERRRVVVGVAAVAAVDEPVAAGDHRSERRRVGKRGGIWTGAGTVETSDKNRNGD